MSLFYILYYIQCVPRRSYRSRLDCGNILMTQLVANEFVSVLYSNHAVSQIINYGI